MLCLSQKVVNNRATVKILLRRWNNFADASGFSYEIQVAQKLSVVMSVLGIFRY